MKQKYAEIHEGLHAEVLVYLYVGIYFDSYCGLTLVFVHGNSAMEIEKIRLRIYNIPRKK